MLESKTSVPMPKSDAEERNKRIFIIWKVLIFIIGVLVVLTGFILFDFYSDFSAKKTINNLNQEVVAKANVVDNFLSSVGKDVLHLSELSSLHVLINSNTDKSRELSKIKLQKDFLKFSKEKKIYYQVRYINEKGQEIVRIDSDGKISKVIPEDRLQNKKGRYYFDDAITLNKGAVFTSPLDLNIERGELENRGTEEDPVYVPVVRYATPIFNELNNPKGIIITNIYANFFLKEIQKNHTNGKIVLLNAKGFYLSNHDRQKEFEFMFDKESSFYKDYPKIAGKILANKGRTTIETAELVASLSYIYPAFFQGVSEENYFWVLGIILDK